MDERVTGRYRTGKRRAGRMSATLAVLALGASVVLGAVAWRDTAVAGPAIVTSIPVPSRSGTATSVSPRRATAPTATTPTTAPTAAPTTLSGGGSGGSGGTTQATSSGS